MSIGMPLLLVCLAALKAALFAKELWLFLIGTIAGGIAGGFIFRGGLSELNRVAEPRHRAAIVVVAFIVVRRAFGRATAPSPPATHCDSWCHPGEPVPAAARAES